MTLLRTLARTLFLAVALAAATAAVSQARSLEEIKKDGKILIATEGQFAPFNFFQGSTLTGFEIDVANAIVAKMGLKPEWKVLGFDALLPGLNQNRWDMVIASHGITDERAKAVTFAAPHYCGGGQIVARNPAINTARDLQGKVVAVQTGTTYLQGVQKLPGLKEVKNFPQDTDARSALMTGRVDAWVTDRFVARTALKANPGGGMHTGELLFVERVAPAVAKGNTALADALSQALKAIQADGTYAKISDKWFKEDIRCK